MKFFACVALCALAPWCVRAQVSPIQHLIELARNGPTTPGLADLATKTLGPHGGIAVWANDCLFISDLHHPSVSVGQTGVHSMTAIPNSPLFLLLVKIEPGRTYAYEYFEDGQPTGKRSDLTGYNSDSYPRPGVPKGTLSQKYTITSKIYDGMTADYWIYASPGVDPNVPAPLMVWQDGQGLIAGDLSKLRLFTVTENLIAQKRIPPMVHVMIAPGFSPDKKPMRSIEYDTLSDRYKPFPDGRSVARSGEELQAPSGRLQPRHRG